MSQTMQTSILVSFAQIGFRLYLLLGSPYLGKNYRIEHPPEPQRIWQICCRAQASLASAVKQPAIDTEC